METKQQEVKFLIPRRFLKKSTIFSGIGLKEIGYLSASFFVGLFLYFFTATFGLNGLIRLILLLIPPGAMFILVSPLEYGENMLIKIKRKRDYEKSTKIYTFSKRKLKKKSQ